MQNYFIELLNTHNIMYANWIAMSLVLCLIFIVSISIHFILHHIVLKKIKRFYHSEASESWLRILVNEHLFNRIILVLQGIIIYLQAKIWFNNDEIVQMILMVGCQIWALIFITLVLFSLLNIWLTISQHNGLAKKIPIRGINQSIKMIVSILVVILIISILIDRSPVLLLSGLGAMTAIVMLVFKDPLLGLMAGIQLSVNKMLNVGDWLEMPKYGADGDVIDITLTTVKVQNWDKTISTIPTYALISDSFKNWQGMSESGGRRIKRSIYIDTTSVKFLTTDDCQSLRQAELLAPYIEGKMNEINEYNQKYNINTNNQINGRRLTNLGTFRAYLEVYLQNHPNIHQHMTLMVRQLAPTPNGLPLEIYGFTNTTTWVNYENIQSDIFDHIFAVIPEFGLRIHQVPTGHDMIQLGKLLSKNN